MVDCQINCLFSRYMYALLTALPWVGRELFEKKENDLERIMAAMEGYLRRRNTAHVAALRVWNCDTPHPQVKLSTSISKQEKNT